MELNMFYFLLGVGCLIYVICKEKRDSKKTVYDIKGYEIKSGETLKEAEERYEKWYKKQ
jgi:hypothetical protein